jgi:hypothetical protein
MGHKSCFVPIDQNVQLNSIEGGRIGEHYVTEIFAL